MSSMREFAYKIESSMIFRSFNDELQRLFPQMQFGVQEYKPTVYFSEIYPSGEKEEVIPNTTQHNVPSWAIFASSLRDLSGGWSGICRYRSRGNVQTAGHSSCLRL